MANTTNNVNTQAQNPMKVITGHDTRWSYANVWEAKSINGGTPKFSVSLIIPKSDTKTIAKIKTAIEAAYREGEAKLKGNGKTVPPLAALKTPLRDGDTERPDDPAYNNPVKLSDKERERYDELRQDLVLKLAGGDVTAANAAALSGKLCQMANGAVYGDDGTVHYIHDRKLDALEDLIEAANGKPVLVAYWFKHDLERISARLKDRHISFTKLDTSDSIASWNEGKWPVALIHPASAGHGLNLQSGGSTIIWFGLTWSLELYQQANARLWRQGQKAETVVLHHIIAKDTIDERVMKALSAKDKTQTALIDAVKANL